MDKVTIDGVEYAPYEAGQKNPSEFAFLKSTRFWVMLGGAAVVYLEAKGWIGEPERNLIATVSAMFVGIRTVDRLGEKVSGEK